VTIDILPVEVGLRDAAVDLLAVGCLEGEAPDLAGLGEPVRAAGAQAAARPGWSGRDEQVAEAVVGAAPEAPAASTVAVVALHGLGRRGDLTWRKLAAWLTRAADAARINGHSRLAFRLPAHPEAGAPAAERILHLLALADHRFDRYLNPPAPPDRLAWIAVLPPAGSEEAFAAAVRPAAAVAGAIAWARNLGNTPSNEATPPWLEEQARVLAESRGMTLTVLGVDELAARGMGGLLAVGAGSDWPPRLLRLEVGGDDPALPAVALVGKGVTFDTGGISIKAATDMDAMKYDKCGACAVLGIARAVADLALPLRLRCYLPVAENVTDGRSFRPGDIVRCYNGRTVETVNTDAEGRLILADAMAWAAEESPTALVEYSTLTGACVMALGHHAAGLFTPDDGLAAELQAAGAECGERLWRLPVGPEYLEEMKGVHADLRNAASRWGEASTAASFLSQFVGSVSRWAHLDIAGVAALGRDANVHAGATGFGVASGVRWLRRLAGES
jgi:leucyl aminopeptidase